VAPLPASYRTSERLESVANHLTAPLGGAS
jgi:hypothetical protein